LNILSLSLFPSLSLSPWLFFSIVDMCGLFTPCARASWNHRPSPKTTQTPPHWLITGDGELLRFYPSQRLRWPFQNTFEAESPLSASASYLAHHAYL
jgi:hypothetical protein